MSFGGQAYDFLRFSRQIAADAQESMKELLEDFDYLRNQLFSEHSTITEKYNSLVSILARFSSRIDDGVGVEILDHFDMLASDIYHLERQMSETEEFEKEFGFLREPRDESGTKEVLFFDSDLIKAVLGSRGRTIESLREKKDRLMIQWRAIVRKILDDAKLRIKPNISYGEITDSAQSVYRSPIFGSQGQQQILGVEPAADNSSGPE